MRRLLFILLSVLSLLISVAIVAMWVRSYVVCDRFTWGEEWSGHTGDGGVMLTVGIVEVWHRNFEVPCDTDLRDTGFNHDTYTPARAMNFLDGENPMPFWHKVGFSWKQSHEVRPSWGRGGRAVWNTIDATAPFWVVVMITLLPSHYLVLLVVRRWKHAQRIKTGLCSQCGYDLRSTPDRCPECGHVPVNPAEMPS